MPPKEQKPPVLPSGSLLEDSEGKEWVLGNPLGSGGCGVIYTAKSNSPNTEGSEQFVVKIEPKDNGPLYTEMFCYQEAAKGKQIASWKKKQKLSHLGIPVLEGCGHCDFGDACYRFLVLQRFGCSIWEKFLECKKKFPDGLVFALTMHIIDALEYLHNKDYVHADIKSANLLLGNTEKDRDKVYLVDFGLASKYRPNDKHREHKEDPRKGHNGTAEFTSIDAHKGVAPSRRGDIQILCYVMLQWMCTRLPWEDKLKDLDYVMNQKIKYSTDIDGLLAACFNGNSHPDAMKEFLTYAFSLGYDEKPDYSALREICQRVTGANTIESVDFKKRTFIPGPNISPGRRSVSITKADTSGYPVSSGSCSTSKDKNAKEKDTGFKRSHSSPANVPRVGNDKVPSINPNQQLGQSKGLPDAKKSGRSASLEKKSSNSPKCVVPSTKGKAGKAAVACTDVSGASGKTKGRPEAKKPGRSVSLEEKTSTSPNWVVSSTTGKTGKAASSCNNDGGASGKPKGRSQAKKLGQSVSVDDKKEREQNSEKMTMSAKSQSPIQITSAVVANSSAKGTLGSNKSPKSTSDIRKASPSNQKAASQQSSPLTPQQKQVLERRQQFSKNEKSKKK